MSYLLCILTWVIKRVTRGGSDPEDSSYHSQQMFFHKRESKHWMLSGVTVEGGVFTAYSKSLLQILNRSTKPTFSLKEQLFSKLCWGMNSAESMSWDNLFTGVQCVQNRDKFR